MAEALILLAVAIVVSSAFMFMVIADGVHRYHRRVLAGLSSAVTEMVKAFADLATAAHYSAVEMSRFAAAFSSTKDPDGPRVL